MPERLPDRFRRWFESRGWQPRRHQLELLDHARDGRSCLLIAPTGAGKTLAGFLPALTELDARGRRAGDGGIHTLYISPLKALAVDIRRNLAKPIEEIGIAASIETRTGDTPSHRRQRQTRLPPDILLTTPEQLALMIANPAAERLFTQLRYLILDELHALAPSKRGHLLALGIARLRRFAPAMQCIGLSATVADPDELRRWLVPQNSGAAPAELVIAEGGARPQIEVLQSAERIPWAGHSARYAVADIYEQIRRHRTTLVFVNTRSQAEFLFQALWEENEDSLPIALHHGSLDVAQRRKVEKAMETGGLRAIVATSTLDLGIDWGDVDLVIHVGAPKGASRLQQRIGRANHRLDEPSKAILVPANRFEVLECRAALEASSEGAQDTPPLPAGALDVLAQHVLGTACAGPFDEEKLYREVIEAAPYRALDRDTFARVVDFVATGGYALRNYERYARIRRMPDGRWRIANPDVARRYRLNVGTIVEAPMLSVRLVRHPHRSRHGGLALGKIEEGFLESLSPGDTFLFAGRVLRFETIREDVCFVTSAAETEARVPQYMGGKFPLSTYLAATVREMIADRRRWSELPVQVASWLAFQDELSVLPAPDQLLVETFPRGGRHFMVLYPFEGRPAHQTLGMLLTRRLERAGARPLGFVASDYALAVWALADLGALFRSGRYPLASLLDEDMLGDDLEAWLAESWMLKRTFRNCALISGLIEKRHPGQEKTGRQVTVSADLIYDLLRSHEPDHILLKATWADAASGLLDIHRLGAMLKRIARHTVHRQLDEISPLAVPVLMDIGKETVRGGGEESLLAELAARMDAAIKKP